NPAGDTAAVAAVRQQPNSAQHVADAALLRVVVPVLVAQNSPMPSVVVAPEAAAYQDHPTVLCLAPVPSLHVPDVVQPAGLCLCWDQTGHRTSTLGHLGHSFDDSTQVRHSPDAHTG